MHPYFTFKDLVTIFAFLLVLSIMVFYYPNVLGHSDNYIPANPINLQINELAFLLLSAQCEV